MLQLSIYLSTNTSFAGSASHLLQADLWWLRVLVLVLVSDLRSSWSCLYLEVRWSIFCARCGSWTKPSCRSFFSLDTSDCKARIASLNTQIQLFKCPLKEEDASIFIYVGKTLLHHYITLLVQQSTTNTTTPTCYKSRCAVGCLSLLHPWWRLVWVQICGDGAGPVGCVQILFGLWWRRVIIFSDACYLSDWKIYW